MSDQPIFIMPPDSERTTGRDAQRMNIQAAKLVAEAVRTTLGPKGMDKMLVDSQGDVTVTNDGVTILEEMEIEHPCAKMVVEIAKTQEHEVGDGTTTAVVIAGELLANAEELLNDGIHPTIIARGYRLAAERAQDALRKIAKPVTADDSGLLEKIALTAMTGKGVEDAREHLATLVLEAVKAVRVRDDVKIETKPGLTIRESEMINGIVLDKERLVGTMPVSLKDSKILLLDTPLEIRNTEIDARISITDPEKLQGFLDMEESMLKKMIAKIEGSGARVVFCQRGIDDLAAHFLAKRGIFAVRRVKKSDMDRLAKATGAVIVSNLDDITHEDLGAAGKVEELTIAEEKMVFVRDCPEAKAVTILVRGSTEHVIAEAMRALEDAIGDVLTAIKAGKVVAGAGAPEMHAARIVQEFSSSLTGREQLAAEAFADALEVTPRTLAENAGLDPIDILAELKAAHIEGKVWSGVNVFEGGIMDAWEAGVLEPLTIKTQALSSAVEVAVMILRIDDVIAAGARESRNP